MNGHKKISGICAAEYFCLALGAAAFAGIVFLLVRGFDRGLDFTDESWYLLSSRYAGIYPLPASAYLLLNHAILAANGYSIPDLRAMGFVLMLLCGGVFIRAFLPCLKIENISLPSRALAALCLLGGCVWIYQWWLLTPSYNSYAFMSLMLYGAGVCGFYARREHAMRLVWLGLGIAACLLSKPPSGVVAAALLPGVLVLDCPRRRDFLVNGALILAIAALMVLAALMPDPLAIWRKFAEGSHLLRIYQHGYELSTQFTRLYQFVVYAFPYVAALPFVVLAGTGLQHLKIDTIKLALLGLLLLFTFIMTQAAVRGGTYATPDLPMFLLTFDFALPLYFMAWDGDKRRLWAVLVLLGLPIAGMIGTGNGYDGYYALGAVFVFAAMMLALSRNRKILLAPLAAVCLIISFKIIYTANLNPYRLPEPVAKQDQLIELPGWAHNVRVDRPTADYVAQLQKAARAAGWKPGTGFIDLTGNTPGAALILGGYPPGFGWLFGGYPGTVPFDVDVLSHAPRSVLESAWVLAAPDSKIAVPPEVMKDLNLDFPGAYEAVATVTFPLRDEKQVLYKPHVFAQ